MIEMTRREIEQMLGAARLGRLCMADRDGHPYAIPMPFCWIDDALYLRVTLTGRKGAILTSNNHVCFEVDDFSEDFQDYASVLIEGRLVPVPSVGEKQRVKEANDAKYLRLRRGYRPGHGRSSQLESIPVQKIEVERVSGRKKDPSHTARAATGGAIV